MLHPADYFELIWGSYSDARHFKSNCFIKLFSIQKDSRKLIAGVFSAEGAVIDCLHHDVRCDLVTVVECSEFHNMGEFHENIKSVEETIAIFKEIPLERMHGIPAIGIRVADPNNLDDGVEMDVLIGKRIDLDILHYVPEIADNWQAQQMIR